MSDAYITVDDQNFSEKVLQSDKPVIVDFWAPWCGPCIRMAPAFERLAGEYGDKITFAKLNTDENDLTASRVGIQGIPTMIVYRGGKEVDRIIGLVPGEVLKRHLETVASATA
jgi:thioredoxin 1